MLLLSPTACYPQESYYSWWPGKLILSIILYTCYLLLDTCYKFILLCLSLLDRQYTLLSFLLYSLLPGYFLVYYLF